MTQAATTRSGPSSSQASASETREELKADADRLKDTARDRASEEADRRKSQATRAAHSTSDALKGAASDLDRDRDAPDWLSKAFRETAGSIDRFASKMDGRSPEQMGRDISSFAREHPTSFLAASAAAGFAAARFLRAGADYKHHEANPSRFGNETRDTAPTGSRFAGETRAAQQRYGESREGMTR